MNWESLQSNFGKSVDVLFSNQDAMFETFNKALDSDKEAKKIFFSMNEEDKLKAFTILMGRVALEMALVASESE